MYEFRLQPNIELYKINNFTPIYVEEIKGNVGKISYLCRDNVFHGFYRFRVRQPASAEAREKGQP